MKLSNVDHQKIIGQGIVNGRLATEFRAGDINPVGGTLICEPAASTPELQGDDFLSCTVTRFGQKFWDDGVFTPRG